MRLQPWSRNLQPLACNEGAGELVLLRIADSGSTLHTPSGNTFCSRTRLANLFPRSPICALYRSPLALRLVAFIPFICLHVFFFRRIKREVRGGFFPGNVQLALSRSSEIIQSKISRRPRSNLNYCSTNFLSFESKIRHQASCQDAEFKNQLQK